MSGSRSLATCWAFAVIRPAKWLVSNLDAVIGGRERRLSYKVRMDPGRTQVANPSTPALRTMFHPYKGTQAMPAERQTSYSTSSSTEDNEDIPLVCEGADCMGSPCPLWYCAKCYCTYCE